jgi:hypothetical protein
MTPRPRSRRASILGQCELRYAVELARGSSYLASTMTYSTLEAAVTETVEAFVSTHGDEFLPEYLELMSRRLSERNKPEAASLVRFWMNCGRSPSADELRSMWSLAASM